MERAIARDDVKSYLRNNYAFHFAIYRAAGSENLLGIIENLWLQISPYFSKLYGSYEIANRHHRVLFHALEARDAAAAQDALRNDINAAYETLSRQVT